MTANEFREMLTLLGLSQTAAAKLLGLTRRTIVHYAAGHPIPTPVVILLKLLLFSSITVDDIDGMRE
jgi:DNA-binding XRE family transcriptional regulator